MEEEVKNQKPKLGRKPRKRVKLDSNGSQAQLKNQTIHDHPQAQGSHDSDSSSGWSKEVIEPAVKSMSFRNKRGTRMKQLLKGKPKKDQFWEKYQDYFGGDLDKPEEQDDLEDYQASSSGRDQFDSDFDLTDSYVGKRGRKKGTKVKKRKRAASKPAEPAPEQEPKPKLKRGRKKKVPQELPPQQNFETLLKGQQTLKRQNHQDHQHQVNNLQAASLKEKPPKELLISSPQKEEILHIQKSEQKPSSEVNLSEKKDQIQVQNKEAMVEDKLQKVESP